MTDLDDFTADAIRARRRAAAAGECVLCGIGADRDCYMPARRCPRPAQKAAETVTTAGETA